MLRKIKYILYELVYQLYQKNIFKNRMQVLSIDKTIQELVTSDKSLVRYGDGEFNIIKGQSAKYQTYNKDLAKRMQEILKFKNDKLLVAIPDIFESLDIYTDKSKKFWKEHLFFYRNLYVNECIATNIYYNAFISRCYYMIKDKEKPKLWFEQIKKIWDNKEVVIVEGAASHNGVGNDLFANVKKLERIICPSKDAYDVLDKIIEACSTYSKDSLFLLALGATAKVLAVDLVAKGYRAIDIGNLDMEYEWYLVKSEDKIQLSKFNCLTKEDNLKAGYNDYLSEIRSVIS